MIYNGRYNPSVCGFIGIPISIVVGVIIGILFAFGFIPFIVTSVWIALGLAVLTLIILVTAIFVAVKTESKILLKCLKQNINCLLAGIFGTLISALAALSIVLVPAFMSIVILVGIGAFFTSWMVISLILFIMCIVSRPCFDNITLGQ